MNIRTYLLTAAILCHVAYHVTAYDDDEDDDSSVDQRGIIRRRRRRCHMRYGRSVADQSRYNAYDQSQRGKDAGDKADPRTLLFVVPLNRPYSNPATNINYLGLGGGLGGGGGGHYPHHSPQGDGVLNHHPIHPIHPIHPVHPAPVHETEDCDLLGGGGGLLGGLLGGGGGNGGYGGGNGGGGGGNGGGGAGTLSEPQQDVGGGGSSGGGTFGSGLSGLGNGIGMSIASISNAIAGAFPALTGTGGGGVLGDPVVSRHGNYGYGRPQSYLRPIYRSIRQFSRWF